MPVLSRSSAASLLCLLSLSASAEEAPRPAEPASIAPMPTEDHDPSLQLLISQALNGRPLGYTRWPAGDVTCRQGLERIGSRRPIIRRNIWDFTPAQRQRLSEAMALYLTEPVVEEHLRSISHRQERLFTHHDRYILEMELHLQRLGLREFLPLPYWDTGEPVPLAFQYVRPHDGGEPRAAMIGAVHWLPMPKHEQFKLWGVCDYHSDQELASAINEWHGSVHMQLGGCMGDFRNAAGAPLFWLWHAFVSQTREHWKLCWGRDPTAYRADPEMPEAAVATACRSGARPPMRDIQGRPISGPGPRR